MGRPWSAICGSSEYFLATKKHCKLFFCDKMSIYGLFADFPLTGRPRHSMRTGLLIRRHGLSQGGLISHKEAKPLTGSLVLKQVGWACPREARALAGRPGSYREAGSLNGKQAFTKGGRASHRDSWPLTGRLGFSQESRPLAGRPVLSQGSWVSSREARPLTWRSGLAGPLLGRPRLSQSECLITYEMYIFIE